MSPVLFVFLLAFGHALLSYVQRLFNKAGSEIKCVCFWGSTLYHIILLPIHLRWKFYKITCIIFINVVHSLPLSEQTAVIVITAAYIWHILHIDGTVKITWPWPQLRRFGHVLTTSRQKEFKREYNAVRLVWDFDCLHVAQYISISPDGIDCKQTWCNRMYRINIVSWLNSLMEYQDLSALLISCVSLTTWTAWSMACI